MTALPDTLALPRRDSKLGIFWDASTMLKYKFSSVIFCTFILSYSFSAFSNSLWTDNEYKNAKTMLLSRKFIENGNGVAIIRTNPAIYFDILNSYLTEIKNSTQCNSSTVSYEQDLKKIFGYTNELTVEQFNSILTEILSVNGHLENIKQNSCTGTSRAIQDVIFDLTKNMVQNEDLDRIRQLRKEQDRLEAERKRIEEEEEIKKTISDDNKKAPSIAKSLSEFQICDALGLSIRYSDRPFILYDIFGSANNLRDVLTKEIKRRKYRVNLSLVEKRSTPLGSSYCQVYASLGTPDDINTNEGPWGIHQQFVYRGSSSSMYVYFKNGVISSIQY